MKSCSLGRIHVGEVCGELSPVRGTSRWSRWRVWGVLPLRRKERQRQRVMNWPQPPFPVPLCHSGGGGRETGVKLSPGRREAGGEVFEDVLLVLFILFWFDWWWIKLPFLPSSVCFVRDSNWWVISPCPCLDPWVFHHISSPLSSWEGGVIEWFWWIPGIYPGQTKTHINVFQQSSSPKDNCACRNELSCTQDFAGT